MIKIGLTGNIASGKSTVESIIADLGYKVTDLDKVSHNLLDTTCKEEVLKTFSTTDRYELSKIVFKKKNELKKLENIIHPRLREYILNYFKENQDEKIVFVSGALIFEAGFNDCFDKIIFVDARKDLRLNRLMKRNSLSKEDALLRINAQSDSFKHLADYIIENNSDTKTLNNNVSDILKRIAV